MSETWRCQWRSWSVSAETTGDVDRESGIGFRDWTSWRLDRHGHGVLVKYDS